MSDSPQSQDGPDITIHNEVPRNQSMNSTVAMVCFGLLVFLGVMLIAIFMKGGAPSDSDAAEIARLKSENAALATKGSTNSTESASALLQQIESQAVTARQLLAGVDAERASLQQRVATAEASNTAFINEIANLKNQLANSAGSAAENAQLKERLESLKKLKEFSDAQLAELRTKPDLSQDLLNAQRLTETQKKTIDSLQARLDGAVSGAEAQRLRAELTSAEQEIETLKKELQKVRAELNRSKLYVEDSANLAPVASALFTELKQLEGSTPQQLREAYARIGQLVNARRVELVAFASGSSQVDTQRYSRITQEVVSANDQSFFLVVGYASKTGDAVSNKKLSARRATTVASVVNSNKHPDQRVQAVFLGQTDRFSPTAFAKNQICEVWEIKPAQ